MHIERRASYYSVGKQRAFVFYQITMFALQRNCCSLHILYRVVLCVDYAVRDSSTLEYLSAACVYMIYLNMPIFMLHNAVGVHTARGAISLIPCLLIYILSSNPTV